MNNFLCHMKLVELRPLMLFVIRAPLSYPYAGIRYLPMICWPLRSRAVKPLPVSCPSSVSRRHLPAVISRQPSLSIDRHCP